MYVFLLFQSAPQSKSNNRTQQTSREPINKLISTQSKDPFQRQRQTATRRPRDRIPVLPLVRSRRSNRFSLLASPGPPPRTRAATSNADLIVPPRSVKGAARGKKITPIRKPAPTWEVGRETGVDPVLPFHQYKTVPCLCVDAFQIYLRHQDMHQTIRQN